MATSSSDIQDTPFGAPPRPLTEEVLQSAEEAVLTNPASVETLQGGEPVPQAAEAGKCNAPWTGSLARHVAEKPVQSALVALVTGAVLTLLVKSVLARRRP